MYQYKTEIMKVREKMFTEKIDSADAEALDERLNQRSKERWELVTYDVMMTSQQLRSAFVITFRKEA